jgi:hypothetical protein
MNDFMSVSQELQPIAAEAQFKLLLSLDHAAALVFVPWSGSARQSVGAVQQWLSDEPPPFPVALLDVENHSFLMNWLDGINNGPTSRFHGNGELVWLRRGIEVGMEPRPDLAGVMSLVRQAKLFAQS